MTIVTASCQLMQTNKMEASRMGVDRAQNSTPRIVSRDRTCLSPWVTLEAVSVVRPDAAMSVDVFHAFRQDDYVHVVAMTRHGEFVLVRQYRPVIERWTLEFPGGLRNASEDPAAAATRELREETGFAVVEMMQLVEGPADVGRLCNKFFGFFALAEGPGAESERGITTVLTTGKELRDHAASGRIATPSHVGLLYLAAIHPRVREICQELGHPAVPWLT
jgi:8-oxo-dGTP pyrophosphatase MutT (NUDIX family)